MAKGAVSVRPTAYDRLDAIGLEEICNRIENGETQSELSRDLGINMATLSTWLNATPERSKRSARAREASAEAWLDRGLETVVSSLSKRGNVDPSAARAVAQECARRAAIRNPKYRDAQKHEVVGKNDGPIQTEAKVDVTLTPSDAYKQMLG